MSQTANEYKKICEQNSKSDEQNDRRLSAQSTSDTDYKMTVTKQKSSTEYTRVLELTSNKTVDNSETNPTVISDDYNENRQLSNEVNKCGDQFNFKQSSTELSTDSTDEDLFKTNSCQNRQTLSLTQMNSTANSKYFVPLSQQTVISSNKVMPISVHIFDDEQNTDSQQKPESGQSPEQYSGRSPEMESSVSPSATLHTPPRPTTLSVCSPIPPEFSISPADSLSKASSSDNIQESSTSPATGQPQFGQQLCAKQSLSSKPPPSPTTLSVHNFNGGGNYWGGSTPLALSPSFNSLQGSLASSINDLTVEAEQLERAIRHNDTRFVRRMLELHNKTVNFSYDKTDSLIDKVSRSSQNLDLDANNQNNKQMLKSQSMIEKFISNNSNCTVDRRESASTDERGGESPSIFTNSLHLAIENNSYDVALLLLRSGIDPNESGVQPYSMETWRRSSHASSDESCAPINATTHTDRLTINNLNLINSQSREPLIRTPSVRSTNSPMLLSPKAGPSHMNAGAGSSLNINTGHNSIYFALNSSPSSINSELSSIGRFSTPVKVIRVRTDMWPNLKVVHMSSDGSGVTYDEEYTRENLYSLPPIYLCVALNNSAILRELIKFGAVVNTIDRYGTTPLHLCLCQEHISRSCLQLLVENGSKLYAKNSQSVAPFQLVSDDMSPHILLLQKSIIDQAFAQIVPKQSTQTQNNNNNNNKNKFINNFSNSNNSNNSNNTDPRVYSTGGDFDVSSVTSSTADGLNQNTISNNNNNFFKRKLQSKPSNNLFTNTKSTAKDVYICLDNVSVHSLEPQSNLNNEDSIQSQENFGGSACAFQYKKSIAESIAPSIFGHFQDEHNVGSPVTVPHHTRDNSISSRLLNRRRSGDETVDRTAFSFIKIGKSSHKHQNQTNNTTAKEKSELIYMNRAENSMQLLNRMASNLECVPYILSNLQNDLLSFISITEKYTDGNKLHKPLTNLLNRLLQTIVEEICGEIKETKTLNTGLKKQTKSLKRVLDFDSKEKLSVQLCGLLRSGVQCLKGGQSLQYTSLLLINKIIDTFIIYDVSLFPIELNETQIFVKERLDRDHIKSKHSHHKSGGQESSSGKRSHQIITQMPSIISSDNNPKQIITSLKTTTTTTTLNSNSSFKENQISSAGAVHRVIKRKASNERNRFTRKTISNWIKRKTITANVVHTGNTVKRDSSGTNINSGGGTGSTTLGNRSLGIRLSANTGDNFGKQIVSENISTINTNLLQILVKEGIDLILNVLNNAITLHKRVTGSKQCCTPSHRLRQCTYHCLQILAARALLYSSQCEEAQNRLISEGPLKVLITSIDSTHDPQLICLALQIVANLAISPKNHSVLIEAEIPDSLMQLILPSDEWFYTNTTTKYAKYVKHQSARIMVYLGLEKRLRNKVYLFDLLEEGLQPETPLVESEEDNYIMSTSLAPMAVHSPIIRDRLLGASIEGIIFNLIKQIENKLLNGEDSECNDPLIHDSYYFDGTELKSRSSIPPAIQVDLPSGATKECDQSVDSFFYLSAFPTAFQPLILLRVLQHKMFGCFSLWAWPSNAVSRSSVASGVGSVLSGENRSRASSTSNALDLNQSLSSRRNVNLTINCSTASLSPARVDIERRTSLKGVVDTRVIIQTSLPITSVTLTMGPTGSGTGNQQTTQSERIPIQQPQQQQRDSITSAKLFGPKSIQQMSQTDSRDNTPSQSPGHQKKPFRFSSLRRKRLSRSTDANSPPPPADTPEKNEAFILAFQRELQNLPPPELSPVPHLPTGGLNNYSNSIASYIKDALERSVSPSFMNTRPRSCSVPRVTFDSFSANSLQLPTNQKPVSLPNSSLTRSVTAEENVMTIPTTAQNLGPNPQVLSPSKYGPKNQIMTESPISCSTYRSASRSGSRSGSAGQVMVEPIMPNTHRAILKLIHDWSRLCPNDFRQNKTILREIRDFLNRISILGENYRWFADEIRLMADISDTESGDENESDEIATSQEYHKLQQLVVSGELPCSKEEAAILAGIQLRIEESWPKTKSSTQLINNSSIQPSQQPNIRQNLNSSEKLRPICEDVKETSPIDGTEKLSQIKMTENNCGFDELTENDGCPIGSLANRKTSLQNSHFLPNVTKRTTSILCNWVTTNWANRGAQSSTAIDLRECLPPIYHSSKNMAKTIKEQKRKLFHSPVYESEQQLKKLYIQTCKRLPAFGCRIFQVKELLRGKTKRRATRLLGICFERIVLLDSKTLTPAKCQPTSNLQQWRTGGGRSHDRLVLEFRGTKWSFITPSQSSLRAIGTVLWEIMQDLDARFLDEHIITKREELDEECRRVYRHGFGYGFDKVLHFREELHRLESLLHFPEEVALRLTEVEYQLFYSVAPVHYIRQVTIGLSRDTLNCFNTNQTQNDNCLTVRELVERFNEVSSWVTHIIISQPTHEMRKAVLSCIMRVVQCCWNLGNFNSAVEILAGLKSEKLKPFWLSISTKDQPVLKEKLSKALLTLSEPSPEYKSGVVRALDIPHSKVIPFFGAFLKDLKSILQGMPSLVVLPLDRDDPNAQKICVDFVADYNGDDHYMSRIGVGGIINMEKMYKTHEVLDNIRAFHIHSQRRQVLSETNDLENNWQTISYLNQNLLQTNNTTNEQNIENNCENDFLYEIDLDSYKPIVGPINNHCVSFVPINARAFDLHLLQAMHHGLTCIHFEEDTGRSSVVYLQLEQSNATLVWCKPSWSTAIKTSGGTPQDYILSLNIEDVVLPGIITKYESKEPALTGLDEGFIDLQYIKDIRVGQTSADLTTIARRHGLPDNELNECRNSSVKLLFGTNLSDNRVLEFLAPKLVANVWSEGLKCLIRQLQQQKQLTDQRIVWLKDKYLQLYYEDAICAGPTPAEAIRVFGGRKWTLDAMGTGYQSNQQPMDALNVKHNSNFGVNRIKKKKSSVSLAAIRDNSPRSMASNHSEVDNSGDQHQSPSLKQRICNIKNQTPIKLQTDKSDDKHNADSQSQQSSSSGELVIKVCSDSPTIYTNSLTTQYREKYGRNRQSTHPDSEYSSPIRQCSKSAITHSSQMDFLEFQELFRSFLIRSRRDIKDIFEQIATKSDFHSFNETTVESVLTASSSGAHDLTVNSPTMSVLSDHSFQSCSQPLFDKNNKLLGILTRNSTFDKNEETYQKARIFDAIAAASIVANSSGIDTLKTLLLTATDFQAFIITYQCENISLDDVKALIRRHEPNPAIRKRNCLSYEGFAKYLMDKDNYAYAPETFQIDFSQMNEPLSHYYMASSHNTYLTGHQLRGESSVELYSQVLSTGCRCVELDCWDGDDGLPVIYHGHTLTSKIPFKKVIETINEKAFVASPYPVILSIENHCSLPQQVKMAQTFVQIFGDKLVTKFQFETDFCDEPQLPSPNQLRYRILIKNKKLRAPIAPALNMKMRANTLSKSMTGRTNSLISTASTGSLNEEEDDEYEDEEDDDDGIDDSLPSTANNVETPGNHMTTAGDLQVINKTPAVKTESSSSQECNSSYGGDNQPKTSLKTSITGSPMGSRPRSQNEEHNTDGGVETPAQSVAAYHSHNKVVRKSSSQIAPELSDLVIYCQAIKFRGFGPLNVSPTNSSVPTPVVKKISSRSKSILVSSNSTFSSVPTSGVSTGGTDTKFSELRDTMSPTPLTSSSSGVSSAVLPNKRPVVSAACYQVSSVNENTAKKLCRKNPLSLIAHTESQIMRTYPAGMRIDSSNFNPVIFWAFGLQSVALNYQTVDSALHINSAMFEQNGGCGLVPKPPVMRDRTHMMFGRFNPWDKEFDGLHAINLTITIISGQYVCQNTNTGSPLIEVEVIGIPVDCNRQRTKVVQRNSLNPIWNDTFMFRVTFSDLSFLRFSVTDMGTNHLTAQRVIPLNCLRQGYRHLRLRSPQNQSLPLSTIFIYSQYEEEGIDFPIGSVADDSTGFQKQITRTSVKPISSSDFTRLDNRDVVGSAPVRRRMFFLVIHGVMADEPSTILKITQDSTASDVINQALAKANKAFESANDYVLIEEVQRGWDKKRLTDRNITQRILDPNERPLEAQSQWKGDGRFVLKKVADDPSSRAWMSSIRNAQKDRHRFKDRDLTTTDQLNSEWTEEPINDTFLVCIYDVSPDQPYTILKANTGSTSVDIISQALAKARRHESHTEFALIEELEYYSDINTSDGQSSSGSRSKKSGAVWRRVLSDNENVYLVQANWKTKGRFELKYKKDLNSNDMNDCNNQQTNSSLNLQKLLRNRHSIKRLAHFHRSSDRKPSDKHVIQTSGAFGSSLYGTRTDTYSTSSPGRQIHSEGEVFSDDDQKSDAKDNTTFQRLTKKLSFRRLKVWK